VGRQFTSGDLFGPLNSFVKTELPGIFKPTQQLEFILMAALLPAPNYSPAPIGSADFEKAASDLGAEVATIRAVAEVESNGSGFDSKGRPTILFEAKYFHTLTHGKYDQAYPNLSQPTSAGAQKYYKDDQWNRMYEAMTLDVDSAWSSASWGMFQIMGKNHSGFTDVGSFVKAMFESQIQHLRSFVAFCQDNSLGAVLQKKDWAAFAATYNGPGYKKNNYDVKLQQAYLKYAE
jgi:hypothetical protein